MRLRRRKVAPDPEKKRLEQKATEIARKRDDNERRLRRLQVQVDLMQRRQYE